MSDPRTVLEAGAGALCALSPAPGDVPTHSDTPQAQALGILIPGGPDSRDPT